jgi:hypothetical protein
LRHNARGSQFPGNDLIETLRWIHFAQHANLDPEGRLRVDRPTRHCARFAYLIVQIIVDIHNAHATLHI